LTLKTADGDIICPDKPRKCFGENFGWVGGVIAPDFHYAVLFKKVFTLLQKDLFENTAYKSTLHQK
jgi:hypothetical protein